MDYSPSGSSVHGISQARILEWVAISSRGSSRPRDQTQVTTSPAFQADYLPLSHRGSPRVSNTKLVVVVLFFLFMALPLMVSIFLWLTGHTSTSHLNTFTQNEQSGPLAVPMCACLRAQSLSHVQLFATPWTAARQAPLSMGILQARMLEWVAVPFSRGPS